jgi:hypothetical protein
VSAARRSPIASSRHWITAGAARTTYLAAGGDAELARQDAAWFDDYAHALDRAYADACGRAAPAVIQCLDDAIGDLRAALTRHERAYWPRLRAIDRCGKPWRERDLGPGLNGEEGLLSPNTKQIALAGDARPTMIRNLTDLTQHEVAIAKPVRYLADGSLVGASAKDEIIVFDPATQNVRHLAPPRGTVIDVSADLTLVAAWSDGLVTIAPIAGGAPVTPPFPWKYKPQGQFSPDGHSFAMTNGLTLVVDDLVTKKRTQLPFRAHLYSVGIPTVRWLANTQLLVNGSAVATTAGNLWRLRLDRNGQLAGPPEIWVASEPDTQVFVSDARDGRILFGRVHIVTRNFVLDHGVRTELISPGKVLYPSSLDLSHHRVLVITSLRYWRWAWMSLEGGPITPLSGLDDMVPVIVMPYGLIALDPRGETPSLVVLDDRGNERSRLTMPWARGNDPRLRCGSTRCVVRWAGAADAGAVTIDVDRDGRLTLGRLQHYADREVPLGDADWSVSPDATSFVLVKLRSSLLRYDLEHGSVHPMTAPAFANMQQVAFTPDGGLLLSGLLDPSARPDIYALVKRARDGRETVLSRNDEWVSNILPIDDQKTLISSVAFQIRFSLLEAPP